MKNKNEKENENENEIGDMMTKIKDWYNFDCDKCRKRYVDVRLENKFTALVMSICGLLVLVISSLILCLGDRNIERLMGVIGLFGGFIYCLLSIVMYLKNDVYENNEGIKKIEYEK